MAGFYPRKRRPLRSFDRPKGLAMRLMGFPASGDQYTSALYRALREQGIEVVEGIYAGRWLSANLRDIDYVHLHWPSFLYNSSTIPKTLKAALRFLYLLQLMRMRGARLIWTAHNLYPHKTSRIPFLDHYFRRKVLAQSRFVVVHGETPARMVAETFDISPSKLRVIHHGHFLDHYPPTMTAGAARGELGLDESDEVFLFIGGCLPYKNVEGLVEAFQRIERPGRKLVIAGRFREPSYRALVDRRIADQPRGISVHDGYIPDDRIQVFALAANVVVLPFKEILTSGSAILALGFGRPVVAPRMGHLIDVIGTERGVLYEGSDPGTLAAAMERAAATRYDPEALRAFAATLTWESAALLLKRASTRTRRGRREPRLCLRSHRKDRDGARTSVASRAAGRRRGPSNSADFSDRP
ncbi:MAG: glycosyltransferase [Planctomycetes bacterium]|nr:glycosyltransferase [Planctomycetota bacterium]